jgi:arylsulfatase A-like enzyme
MLTGMYSHTTGAVSNVEGTIPARFPLVSDILQKAGYEIAFIGKSHIEGALIDHHWDYYFGFVGQADYYRPRITEGIRGKYGPETLYEGEYVDTLLTRKGKSMLPLAEGKSDVRWRKEWLYEYYEYPGFENVRPCRGVRTERYKLIHFFLEPQEFELYDLQTDPDEMNNLYGKPGYEELTAGLKGRLAALRAQTNDAYQYKSTGLPLHGTYRTQSESGLVKQKNQ